MKSVIELVKTSQGYSILEDGVEINRVSGKATKQKQYNNAPKKFTLQNFTIYPYVYGEQLDEIQKYIIIPAKSQWFNLNQVHQIQKKALPEWFRTKKVVFGAAKPDKFEKNQQLYKKYRNYIIQLGKNQYISPTKARKGLAGDVSSILRIHSFLQRNGLINYVFSKNNSYQGRSTSIRQQDQRIKLKTRKDCMDKDKLVFDKHFDKDYIELLKKITKRVRPICHLCQGICGVMWFQYQQELVLKQFSQTSKKQNFLEQRKDEEYTKNSKTNIIKAQKSFKYLLRLCANCFTSGNLPIVLSLDDFKKVSVLDNLCYQYEQPKDKKKINQQNKLIQLLQKSKFNLKKSAQLLKIPEVQLLVQLLCIPLIKIQKLARIDPETEEQMEQQNQNQNNHNNDIKVEINKQELNHKKQIGSGEPLMTHYKNQIYNLLGQQIKLHEQLLQIWLLKISTKLSKLSDWQKSTNWYASRLICDQKNTLAQNLKNKS